MDQGRRADLERLENRIKTNRETTTTRFNDATEEVEVTHHYNGRQDRAAKAHAGAARAKIIAQSRDHELTRLRNRLIRAQQAGDLGAVKRAEARIKHYLKEPFEDYD